MAPVNDRRRIAWRVWLVGALVLVVAAALATYGVRRWLAEKPYADHVDEASDAPDGGLLRLEALGPADAGIADAALDAGRDGGPGYLDGPAPGAVWGSRTRNYLLVGVDRKPWGRGGGLADTIILAALDMRSGHVGLVSIPRDYYIEYRPGEFGRINVAFSYARENGMSRGGYLAKVASDLLGVPIRDAFIVDLTVLERVVDAVGGVSVDVPCPIRDNFIDPRTDTGRRLLDVPSGTVTMDGVTAAMYARSRHGRSDWDRARRQQAVVLALRRRVASLDALSLVPRMLDELEAHIETDLTTRELLDLARFGLRVSPGNMHGMVLASTASQHYRTDAGWSVLIPNVDAIRSQIAGLFDAPAPGVESHPSRCADADAALRGRTARAEDGRHAPPDAGAVDAALPP